tara:strand:- start:604 stop:1254 length:651 start_codon:yes stop_codon:yes gene_type:complete
MNIDIEKYINIYLQEKKDILENYPVEKVVEAVELVFDSYMEDRTIFSMANGGNSGTLDHLYCDFTHHPFVSEDKHSTIDENIKRLNYVNLCSSPAELTGLVNDFGVEEMYVAALRPKIKEKDLVMGFSGSGNSKNIVNAFKFASSKGAKTISISKGDGGESDKIADVSIIIPGTSNFPGQVGANDNNFHFEDEVLSINSIIVGLLKLKVELIINGK